MKVWLLRLHRWLALVFALPLFFVIGTGLLHGCGIALGLIHHLKQGANVVRAAGILIASGGCYYFYRALL